MSRGVITLRAMDLGPRLSPTPHKVSESIGKVRAAASHGDTAEKKHAPPPPAAIAPSASGGAPAGLAEWAAAIADESRVLAERRDADGAMQDRALALVRAFIVERGLILYGGLAIDYALRLRGENTSKSGRLCSA